MHFILSFEGGGWKGLVSHWERRGRLSKVGRLSKRWFIICIVFIRMKLGFDWWEIEWWRCVGFASNFEIRLEVRIWTVLHKTQRNSFEGPHSSDRQCVTAIERVLFLAQSNAVSWTVGNSSSWEFVCWRVVSWQFLNWAREKIRSGSDSCGEPGSCCWRCCSKENNQIHRFVFWKFNYRHLLASLWPLIFGVIWAVSILSYSNWAVLTVTGCVCGFSRV